MIADRAKKEHGIIQNIYDSRKKLKTKRNNQSSLARGGGSCFSWFECQTSPGR